LVSQHVPEQRRGDEIVVLGGLEYPSFFRVHRLDDSLRADRGEQRNLRVGDDVENRQRVGRRRRPDDRVDAVLLNELLGVLHRARRVASVLELEVGHAFAFDPGRQQRGGVPLRNADRRGRPRGGHQETDLHLRRGLGERQDREQNKTGDASEQGSSPKQASLERREC